MKELIKKKLNRTILYKQYITLKKKYVCMIPKEKYIRQQWRRVFNEELDLSDPKTFNEKLQWSKLYADNELARQCADKAEVLNYVESKVGHNYINEIYGIYPNIESIDFTILPEKFVLKATHDSGSVLIVKDKNQIDYTKLNEIQDNLKLNYGSFTKEWVYDRIKPKIIIEKYLSGENNKSLKDYKVFCFNGKAKLIQVDFERFEGHKRNFYDPNWTRLDLRIEQPNASYDEPRPKILEEMLKLSEVLAAPFNHVRVDWYIHQNNLIFGEMTFFHGGGFERFYSKVWEDRMGSWFELSTDLSY